HGRPSRAIVAGALTGLANVKHRGAVAADSLTSDGCGLLTTIPRNLFPGDVGVATLFIRGEDPRPSVEAAAKDEGIEVLQWRTVPVDASFLGELAQYSQPEVVHVVFSRPADVANEEVVAYRFRRRIERLVQGTGTYVSSCSYRTIVFKGLAPADGLADVFPDLHDEAFEAPFAIFHQRFSTNTLPTWERSQPFRMLC
ncbi:hypothetical protein B7486_74145, partial [cyanobacterium TDX16]